MIYRLTYGSLLLKISLLSYLPHRKRHTSFDHRVSVSEDGSVAEMELPGFDFGDLNRAGI